MRGRSPATRALMYRPPMTRILVALGIPAWAVAAPATPAAASSDNAARVQHESSAASLWKPPMPCVAVRAGAFPVGAGFCPDTNGVLDWHAIDAALRDTNETADE